MNPGHGSPGSGHTVHRADGRPTAHGALPPHLLPTPYVRPFVRSRAVRRSPSRSSSPPAPGCSLVPRPARLAGWLVVPSGLAPACALFRARSVPPARAPPFSLSPHSDVLRRQGETGPAATEPPRGEAAGRRAHRERGPAGRGRRVVRGRRLPEPGTHRDSARGPARPPLHDALMAAPRTQGARGRPSSQRIKA